MQNLASGLDYLFEEWGDYNAKGGGRLGRGSMRRQMFEQSSGSNSVVEGKTEMNMDYDEEAMSDQTAHHDCYGRHSSVREVR